DPNFSRAMIETRRAYRRGIEHPKLDKLMKILKKELKKEDIKRIIVFTQFRDTVEQIYKKCKEEKMKAAKFYGQGTRTGAKGLTQKEQKEIIKAFRIGKYSILVSTSVAEEGMDIPSVDLVILYEPVPSEIRMIQRRGRTGRKRMGRMMVMITEKTRDEAYYWSSIRKENKMKKHLQKAKNMEIEIKSRAIEHKKTPKSKYIVYADSREVNSRVLRELTRMDIKVIIKSMAVADYQISEEVAIERKTTNDFINSLIDKRLYKQARELVREFKKPIMILEGEDLYTTFINPNAIRGAIASIAVDFGIPIIPTRSPEDTAAMIKRIAVREQSKEKAEIQIRTEKKPLTLK
ncbi:MAG: Hef nuclease, partial [Methanobacteriales archaeon]|nr:Hef nuclease [Methanobacteriales archaeon]